MAPLALQVLERAKQYRPMGAGIGIDVNGMKAIEAIDPSLRKWFNAEGLSLPSSIINDHKGNPLPFENLRKSLILNLHKAHSTCLQEVLFCCTAVCKSLMGLSDVCGLAVSCYIVKS